MNSDTDSIKILVIDDEAVIRQSFTDHLEDRNYEVLTAENGCVGLNLIEKEQPHMILVDLRMPELDGLELLKRSKETAPDIPKIVVSGANRLDDVVRALRYGACDYLIKPVKDFSMLDHAVEKALEKARLLRENRAYQENLETLVQERTRELEQANTNLSGINTRLKNIVETTKGLSACVEMERFGPKILDEFAHHMVATGGSLYFTEQNGLKLIHSLDPGHAPDFLPFPLKTNSILAKVMKSHAPILIKDLQKQEDIQSSGWNGYTDGSSLAFPIPGGSGEIIGILTLHSKTVPPFNEQDKEIGSILASYSCETIRAVQSFEALQKSEKQYRALFEKSNDAIFVVQKNTGQYLDANKAAARLTGRTIEELKKLTTKDITPDSEDKRLLKVHKLKIVTNLGEINYQRPDKTSRIANLTIVPLDEQRVIGIARDITHDLEVERQLRQSQKMEAIGTLAGGIAHDFNNILSGIFGYIHLAKMDIDDPKKLRINLKMLEKGAQRAGELVQHILTFSRQTEHHIHRLELYLVVQEAVKFLRSSIPAGIDIQEKISSRVAVLADPGQVHQVVMNLCTNAYQAMQDIGGTLTVTLSDIDILPANQLPDTSFPPGPYVKLEVKDTGCGMGKRTLERIFDPYYTTKQPGKGTGLGLAVVDGIVKNHNGFIKAGSEPGVGSRFEVFWPIISKECFSGLPNKSQAIVTQGTERIMLVDDETAILDTTQTILERQGYKVTVFQDGRSAFQAFLKNPEAFDLVVTDMAMPEMNGDVLLQKVLKLRNDIPTILCTGFADKLNEVLAKEKGITKYLQKPIAGKEMSLIIREIFDGKK